MKDNPERNNANEPDEAETFDYEDIDTPDFSLTLLAKYLSEGAVANAKFIEKNFPDVLFLLADFRDELFQDKIEKGSNETMFTIVLEIGSFQFFSLVDDLLSANIPGGYASMRSILEGVVDSVVACTRLSDYPFPENLEMLRQLERELNVSISKKCSLLLPKEINKQTRNKIYKLYDYLSKSWVHPKGTAKKFKEGSQIPGWPFIPPVKYDDWDKDGLSEFFGKLRELRECVHELLQSTLKLSAE